MQDEREPFGRRQRVEHDEESEAHRVGEHGAVLGTVRGFDAVAGQGPHDGIGHVHVEGVLPA